ncbi:hypothetical protein [Dyella japonica]|uniref:Uncharacterized protein n=1 Tax=Dyella japonica DSM 16301 TaxID=1440762 RepID=A0A0G9H7J4_9GAMM|nr:hypothetical protein [Dyella japonica]KLD65456.1 hypothetical protein Y882_02795 [Dyella japonica DSM 16301]
MSRRFGRNQKRRLREQVAHAEAEARRADLVLTGAIRDRDRLRRDADRYYAQLKLVARSLGPMYVGLPTAHIGEAIAAVIERTEAESVTVSNAGRHVDCAVMRVTGVSDRLRDDIHFHVKSRGVHAAYGMSWSALLNAPVDVVAEQIARELAHGVVREIRGPGVHREFHAARRHRRDASWLEI